MADFIEGVGDEVLWFLLAAIVIVLVSLAWISTGMPPVDYYVWLVQMQIHPNRRIVQVLQVDNQDASFFRDRPERRRAGAVTEQALEALMDSGVVEPNNAPQEELEAVEILQRSDNNLQNIEEEGRREQRIGQHESLQNEIPAVGAVGTGEWQQNDPPQASASSGKESDSGAAEGDFDAKRDLAAVVTDSAHRFASGEGSDSSRDQLSSVKLKFLDDSQVIASIALDSTVGQFKRRYFWESILAGKVVRLIYRGQLLRDDTRSLLSYGLHDQCVVHCHVSSTPYAQPSSSSANASVDNNALLRETTGINSGTAAAAIAAIAGAQSVSVSPAGQLTRRIVQTFRGRSIEDNRNDSIFIRIRNAILRMSRYSYNAVMGPDPGMAPVGTSLEAAADAAARGGWNDNQNVVGIRIGQYIHIIFIVKFVTLWMFVFLYPQYTDRFSLLLLTFLSIFFATILFSNSRRTDSNNNHNNNNGVRAQT